METLKGKNILVAGATGTIGAAAAKLLASSGANVFLTGRDSRKLGEIASELSLTQDQCLAADLTKEQDVEMLKQSYSKTFSSIDILVNAAGIGVIKPIEQLTAEEFMKTIQINLFAPFLLIKSFLPDMKSAGKGLIINIPGILGKSPMAGAAAYTASKYGLNGMMQSIREEIKRTNIRITNLFLGGTDSAFWDEISLRVQREKMVTAQEAARAIWFLCQQPDSGVVNEMVLQPFNHQVL